jgi:hypothetical protein
MVNKKALPVGTPDLPVPKLIRQVADTLVTFPSIYKLK